MDTLVNPVADPASDTGNWDEDVCHIVCCVDDNISRCGKNISQANWKPTNRNDIIDCPMCGDREREFCCPLYGYCVTERK